MNQLLQSVLSESSAAQSMAQAGLDTRLPKLQTITCCETISPTKPFLESKIGGLTQVRAVFERLLLEGVEADLDHKIGMRLHDFQHCMLSSSWNLDPSVSLLMNDQALYNGFAEQNCLFLTYTQAMMFKEVKKHPNLCQRT